jgi:histidinol-phosphatase (PHP family)
MVSAPEGRADGTTPDKDHNFMNVERVSVHGGHCGQFCNHAKDTLEEVVQAYIAQGFAWAGLTEHMPPSGDAYLYPEERQAGLTAALMAERFVRYMAEARRLQAVYADRIDIRVAFESEDTPGAIDLARRLIADHAPDYIVGSVHHIDGIPFDYSAEDYARAVEACGGMEGLYCAYFDRQHDLVEQLRPQVVGHFDLIRIFDPLYRRHIMFQEVQKKIRRNLELIRKLDLILDYNVAALKKGAFEPYLCQPILVQARYLGIAVVPGDDSHGVAQVGLHLDEGIRLLQQQGIDTRWRRPGTL